MKKVIYFTDLDKLGDAFEYFDMKVFSDKKFPFKLHMGEIKNKYFPRKNDVKKVIDGLKRLNADPFLYDTTVAYPGLRSKKLGYHEVARIHGFKNLGCDVVIDDKGVNVKVDDHDYEVGENLYNSSYVFAFSHVKGHVVTGMGGAIKNFGMGGVTRETKKKMHHFSKPVYQKDKCTFCGVCAEVCPFDAIKVKDDKWKISRKKCFGCGVCIDNCSSGAISHRVDDFSKILAHAAYAALNDKNTIFLNDVNRISKSCDCDPFSGPIICPDVGFLLSDDPVAIDQASVDLINSVKEDIFKKENKVDPEKQIKYGEEIGLGSTSYQLIEI